MNMYCVIAFAFKSHHQMNAEEGEKFDKKVMMIIMISMIMMISIMMK